MKSEAEGGDGCWGEERVMMCFWESSHGIRKLLKLSKNFKTLELLNSFLPFATNFFPF